MRRRGRKREVSKDRCIDCEYGKGFIELCECPLCHKAVILGDVRTRKIHCPNGCSPLPFAVDFCAEKNCCEDVYRSGIDLRKYQMTVRGSLNSEQIKVLSRHLKESVAQIFLKARQEEGITKEMNIFAIKSLEKYLESQSIEYIVCPEPPLISRLEECWMGTASSWDLL